MNLTKKESSSSRGENRLKKSGHAHGLGSKQRLKFGHGNDRHESDCGHKLDHRHQHGHGQENARGMTLDTLKPGETARIRTVGGEKALRRHLLDMGLTPNTLIMVRKVAPLGDPIELHLRNFELTLRKEDARHIGIEEVVK